MKLTTRIMMFVLAAALVAAGCGSSGGSGQTAGTATTAAKASVTLSAKFPQKDGVVKSLIDSTAEYIQVTYEKLDSNDYGSVYLTKSSPSASLTLAPGAYWFTATSYDASYIRLDYTETAGVLNAGANDVVMTFLGGTWTFSTSAGAASPIVLSNGVEVTSIDLIVAQTGPAKKTALDKTKPFGYTLYNARVNFNNYSSMFSGGLHISQFTGGTGSSSNFSSFDALSLNLTQKCDDWYGSGDGCNGAQGDVWFGLIGMAEQAVEMIDGGRGVLLPPSTMSQSDGTPVDLATYNTAVKDGTTITGYAYEAIAAAETFTIKTGPYTAKAVAASLPKGKSAGLLALASKTGVRKAQSTPAVNLTNAVNKYYEAVVVCADWNNTGSWQLGKCNDADGDNINDFCFDGYPMTPGDTSCGYGLSLPQGGSMGEWVDTNNDGDVSPWEFFDVNGDGAVDYGDFTLDHYLEITDTMSNLYLYPITLKGTEFEKTTVQVQKK